MRNLVSLLITGSLAMLMILSCSDSKNKYRYVDYNAMSDQQRGEMLIERVKTRESRNFILSDDAYNKKDICDWIGIQCDGAGNVSDISWHFFDLIGYMDLLWIPPKTERFQTHGNEIGGKIEAIKLPRGLRVLNISGCAFHGELRFADLPSSLEELFISGNNCKGTIYMSEAQRSLRAADFSENYFTALIGDPRDGFQSIQGVGSVIELNEHQQLWSSCQVLKNRDKLLHRSSDNLHWLDSVFANDEGHVENVFWPDRSLEGSMPSTSLPQFVISIHLNDNLLSGTLDLRSLPTPLQLLDLSNNKFEQSLVEIIPHDGIERFDFRGNLIDKVVSPDGSELLAPMIRV